MIEYQTVPLQLIGPTDQVYSLQNDGQLAQNYFAYPTEDGPALQGFPGSRSFAAVTAGGADRGFHVFNDVLYQVSGTTLDRINQDGTRTLIGTIPGSGRCIMDDDGAFMFIVTGGKVYEYGSSLAEVTDGDLESPNGVTYINSQFFYDGSGQRFVVSEVGDGGDVRQDNYATAESNPDDILLPYAFEGGVLMFGKKTIEPWYFSDSGSPPYDRLLNATIQKGLKAVYSVANTDSHVYFLADDLNVYRLAGNQVENISNPGINKEIGAFTDPSDVIGFCFNLAGQDFYFISSESGNRSYLYSAVADQWTTLTHFSNGTNNRHLASSYAYCYGKHLIADRRTGEVLEWDLNLNQDNGDTIQRRRTLPKIDGEKVGAPGERIQMDRLVLMMQKGVGLATGQGSDPIIMVEISIDGGHSFQTVKNLRFGKAGEFLTKVECYNPCSGYEIVPRITQTDPVLSNLRSAAMDLKAAGW